MPLRPNIRIHANHDHVVRDFEEGSTFLWADPGSGLVDGSEGPGILGDVCAEAARDFVGILGSIKGN